jgi:DNA polymerase III subunit delta
MPPHLRFLQFRQALIRGAIEPVYLFEGEEQHFHDEGIRLLEKAVLAEGAASVDRESLHGAETGLSQVLDLAATYPMVATRRLIVVRGADALRCESAEALKDYLARPNPKSCLVFSDVAFDRRRLLYRALLSGTARIDCAPLDESAAAVWVRQRLRDNGFGISADLADAIAAGLAGAGLGRLDAELQKLMSAIGEPRAVEPSDLAILADVPRVADAFRLALLVCRGERGEAVVAARALLRSGEDPLQMLGGLAWYFRNALRARAASARRLPPRETTALYAIDPGRIERFQREVGKATVEDLREALALCLRADRELKGFGAKDPAHAFERLIHGVARHSGRPA